MAIPTLTQMRRAVWSAVDAWPAFDGLFRRKFKLESRGALDPQDYIPTMGDLPAIAIGPAGVPSTPWHTNQTQIINYAIDVTVWTSHRSVNQGELIWEQFNRCVWQQTPPGSGTTYLFHTDHGQLQDHTVTQPGAIFIADADGVQTMMRWSWSMTLNRLWNPRQETTELDLVEAI